MAISTDGEGILVGRHYRSGRPIELRWREGLLTQVREVSTATLDLPWVAPALVDLQVNGYAGVDFQQDDLRVAELLRVVRALRVSGCTRFFLTLITDHWPRLMRRLRRVRSLCLTVPELRAAIAGWHVEGPFLSPEPGYCGAHDPRCMSDPAPEAISELRESCGHDPILLTLAPERAGALESIRAAVAMGITVSLGHTNASAAQILEAVEVGASGFTHLGNACPRELDRHDNILWRVLDGPEMTISLIPDGIHVSPALFRLVHRLVPSEALCYTTDAMAAAGAPPGRYRLGGLELDVAADGVVRQPGKTHFAGSALRPLDGVSRAVAMLDRPWRELWDGFSERPARWAGLAGGLLAGEAADFCVLPDESAAALEACELYAQYLR